MGASAEKANLSIVAPLQEKRLRGIIAMDSITDQKIHVVSAAKKMNGGGEG